jgi:hypothetical protein
VIEPAEKSVATPPGRALSRAACAESYIAVAIALLFVSEKFVAPFPLIPRFGEPVDLVIGLTLFACGWLFSLSGVRHANGKARIAARVSLAFFALLTAFMVVVLLVARWH